MMSKIHLRRAARAVVFTACVSLSGVGALYAQQATPPDNTKVNTRDRSRSRGDRRSAEEQQVRPRDEHVRSERPWSPTSHSRPTPTTSR